MGEDRQTFLRGAQQKTKATVTSCNKGNANWEGKQIISVGLEHHWNGPKGAVQPSPLEIFKTSQGLEQFYLILKLLLWAEAWNTELQKFYECISQNADKIVSILSTSQKRCSSLVRGQGKWLITAVTYLNLSSDLIWYIIRLSAINY